VSIGDVLQDNQGKLIVVYVMSIGKDTNNLAEIQRVKMGLDLACKLGLQLHDPGGYRWPPIYSTGSKNSFPPWQFLFSSFRVPNFEGRFEALNIIFRAHHS
jgi:hypothetical protein